MPSVGVCLLLASVEKCRAGVDLTLALVWNHSVHFQQRTVLFVTGFRRDLRARDLAYEFEIFGRLVRCDIPALRGPNSSPYAFIEFRREEAAEDAYFDMHGRMIDGQKISVQWAKNSPSSQWRHEESDRSVQHRAGHRRDDRRGGYSDRDDRRGGYPPRRRSRSRSPGYDRDRRRSPSPRRRSPSPRRSLSPPPRRERERSIGGDDRDQRDDAAPEDRAKERDVERERSVDRVERATQEEVAIRRERETSRDD
ncbi:rna-binding domain-containing protein [Phaffia rhodozyma]|uniref:Rna-binding domain-containing protein n=1 Tax=Phaffia rhodozyma TaxID=264483 RepID=A0A0F7ST19_PHARH|nr:rna-binding domain-containing protein [Phaffia rhodozyma]